jgi:hypothetical protein
MADALTLLIHVTEMWACAAARVREEGWWGRGMARMALNCSSCEISEYY